MGYIVQKEKANSIITYDKPKNIIDADMHLFKEASKSKIEQKQVSLLKKLTLTYDGLFIKNFKILAKYLIWPKHKKHYGLKYIFKIYLNTKNSKIESNYIPVVCFDYWSHGYYHWFCDSLPRILNIKFDNTKHLLLLPESYKNNYIQESLNVLGINNVFYLKKTNRYFLTHFLYSPLLANSGEHNPTILKQIKNYFVEAFTNLPTNNKLQFDKIYVSRKKTNYRFILNELEVEALLIKYGFHCICFENYTLIEQIQIANSAKILVGQHGANLTNMLFLQENANIVELRKNSIDQVNCYYTLANALNLNYYYLNCEYVETKIENNEDIYVNLSQLEEIIILLLSK